MRISDWSSDVCSSDLSESSAEEVRRTLGYPQSSTPILLRSLASLGYLNYEPLNRTFRPTIRVALLGAWLVEEIDEDRNPTKMMRSLSADRKRVGKGQSVSVSVDLGGRRNHKKQ